MLHEYYVTVTAKLDPGLTPEEAREDVLALGAWNPLEPSLRLVEVAWEVEDRWGFSFWDSLIVAAAHAQGCGTLLTEDLRHGQELGDLRIVSPSRSDPDQTLF